MQNLLVSLIIIIVTGISALVFGQSEGGIKPSIISGDVVSVAAGKIVVNAKTGQIDAVIGEKTQFKRVPPGASAKDAVAAAASDVSVGDMLTVTGVLSTDGKSLPARAVYLMTKADISQKNAGEAEAWRTRGIAGKVATVNTQTNQITLEMGGMMNKTTVTLTPKADAKFLRYSNDSVKFVDAKASSLTDIKAGDEIRALGDKSSDGTAFAAETVLTGSFRQTAGTVTSIHVEKKEVVIKELSSSKDVTIAFGDAVWLKRFPAEMAERMAGMQAGGAPGAVRPVAPGAQAGGQPPAGAQGPRPMGGGMRPGGEMFERFPNITAADLKVGDTIAILTSGGNVGADRIKAFKLVAGVEAFVKMAQASQAANPGRGGRGVDFNIPGLDGIGGP